VPSSTRERADAEAIQQFLRQLGRRTSIEATVYLAGGASAVLYGWRQTTIDIALRLEPDADELLRTIAILKEELKTNVELASPFDFIPELPGWRDRSTFLSNEGRLVVRHLDLYSQALAKVERDHAIDRADVRSMIDGSHVQPMELRRLFDAIEPNLFRFPAIDPPSFRANLEGALEAPK